MRFFYFETRADGQSTMSAPWYGGAIDAGVTPALLRFRARTCGFPYVSTGPILQRNGHARMFYNGCEDRGRWRVGLLVIDSKSGEIVERPNEPLLDRAIPGGTGKDILFATSAVDMDDEISV